MMNRASLRAVTQRLVWSTVLLALLGACEAVLPPDASIPDVSVTGTLPDVTLPDVTTPDVTSPDVTEPEVTTPPETVPDTTTPEETVPDTTEAETTTPDESEEEAAAEPPEEEGTSPWLWIVLAAVVIGLLVAALTRRGAARSGGILMERACPLCPCRRGHHRSHSRASRDPRSCGPRGRATERRRGSRSVGDVRAARFHGVGPGAGATGGSDRRCAPRPGHVQRDRARGSRLGSPELACGPRGGRVGTTGPRSGSSPGCGTPLPESHLKDRGHGHRNSAVRGDQRHRPATGI